ncbi:MAG: copper resistance CopC family protein [Pseudonocardiaceae bacterium]
MTLRPSRHKAVTVAATVLALMLLLGPVVANALTTGSTQPGLSLRGNVNVDGFADLTAAVGKGVVAMHNELISTDPTEGAQLDTGPARVTLVFDLPAQRGFSTIIVTGPDGNQWQAGPATEDGTSVSAPVRPLGPAGAYTVAWRIISADGHSTRGTLAFTLTTPGPGTAAASPPNADNSGGATPATDTGSVITSVWPWAAGAGALLAVGVVLALRTRRTRG